MSLQRKKIQLEALTLDKHFDLVEKCRTGSSKAQYELYRLYSRSMFNVAVRILNDTGDAEDVLQESFIDAFDKLDGFRNESTFGGWLKRIVINNSINYLRARRVKFEDIDSHPEVDVEDEVFDEEEIVLRVNEVRAAIQQLADGYRTVLTLYLLEGYDHEEIAEILRISESTSRTQYIRAKKRLLELLKAK
ncbi:RNA polymerase sigma factor [Solitalea lacus]|uniref:RNA polymerase sigma factor n=1 Tax=Solitalea lacus TaxID=2911172 RepID=UPI001EDA73C7|nr:RNA polymerase sigma factor [Solitalea lacus]UKJ07575.1 RNA polymerase sigma factor [Solitalea lacus]